MPKRLLVVMGLAVWGCSGQGGPAATTPLAVREPSSVLVRRLDPATPIPPAAPTRVRQVRRAATRGLDVAAAAREHIAATLGSAVATNRLAIARVHDTGKGPIVVKLREVVDSVPVFRSEAGVVMTRDRELVAVTGDVPGGAAAVRPAARPRTRAGAGLDAAGAVARALSSVGGAATPGDLVLADVAGDLELYRLRDPAAARVVEPVAARRVWYRVAEGLVAAHHVQVIVPPEGDGPGAGWSIVVSADDGRVLFKHDRVVTAGGFSYRLCESPGDAVFLASSPFGDDGIPHPTGRPDGYQPSVPCAASLVTPVTADPWLADGATTTQGNNVDAYVAICADSAGNQLYYRSNAFHADLGDFRGSVTSAGVFDHPYDQSLATSDRFCTVGPSAGLDTDPQVAAKLVQAFAVGNMLRDLTYPHGFDEDAGNMQQNNHGRGGLEHDRLRVLVDAAATFASPTSDGLSPYLSLGRSSGTRINRDMTFDLAIAAHEWMHILSNRLVGDSDGLTNSQGGALGEGWSDFMGLLTMVRAGQDATPANAAWTGVYGLGGYANTSYCFPRPCTVPAPGQDQSWYFGIRRYPYTVDLGKSPLTFRWIENDVPLPAAIPHTFWQGRYDNAEIHSAGEIWASALWHCYRELLLDPRNDFAAAQGKMLDYVIAGLKATPVDPTFTEARDALLAAVAASDATDLAHFRAAFAARGMGAGAISPARDSVEFHGVVESFAAAGPGLALVRATLGDDGTGDADGVLDVGETGSLRLVLHNTGFVDLSAVTVTVEGVAGVVAPASQAVAGLAVAAGDDVEVTVPLALLTASTYELLPLTVRFGDAAAGLAEASVGMSRRVSYDVRRTAFVDDAEQEPSFHDWDASASTNCYRELGWTRVDAGGNGVYSAPLGPCSYEAILDSPGVWVPAGTELVVSFRAAFNAARSGGMAMVAVLDENANAAAGQYFEATTAGYPALSSYEIRVPADSSPRVLRVRLMAGLASRVADELGGFVVDDVTVGGAESPVFSVVVPSGANGGAGSWPPVAGFDWSADGLQVTFADATRAGARPVAALSWSLGDGSAATGAAPVHTYALPGEYLVTLLATDDQGTTARATALVRPEQELVPGVRFEHPTGAGTTLFSVDVPRRVDRLVISAPVQDPAGWLELRAHPNGPVSIAPAWGADLYGWGDPQSGLPVATIVVDDPPVGRWHFSVYGAATSVLVETVGVHPPAAAFAATVAGGEATFTDRSTDNGRVVAWAWTFGDGATSAEQSPTHRYAASNTYTVTLTVTDDDGYTASVTQQVTVVVPDANPPPTASFRAKPLGLTVAFTDQSTDDSRVVAWSWDFGDGASSTERSPTHSYGSPGTYTVVLTVTDDEGASGASTQAVTVRSLACAAVPGQSAAAVALLVLLGMIIRRARLAVRAMVNER